jgi:hypothetical protein
MIDREGNAWRGADGEAGESKENTPTDKGFF